MQCRRIELALDALEVIEPLDRMVELRAFLFGELGFHLGNLVGESLPIDLLDRGRDIGQHGQALVGDFGQTAEHDDLLMRAAGGHRQNSRPDRRHDRRVAGEHAEIAFGAGNVNLVDLKDTISGFKGLVEGKYDHLPEAAFYMVGSIEEAVEKGKKLAAEA